MNAAAAKPSSQRGKEEEEGKGEKKEFSVFLHGVDTQTHAPGNYICPQYCEHNLPQSFGGLRTCHQDNASAGKFGVHFLYTP